MNTVKINISAKSVLLFFALICVIFFIVQTRDVLLLLFGSFVIASSLLPAINFLSKKMPKNLAVAIVYTSLIVLIITLFVPLVNILISEGNEFIRQVPFYLEIVAKIFEKWNINIDNIELAPNFENISSIVMTFGQDIINQTINITHNIFVGIIVVTSLAMLVLFMLLEKEEFSENFLKFFPEKNRAKTSEVITRISKGVGIYVGSKIILMFLVCLMSAFGLSVLGIKFALFLGLVAGILEILPIFGPIIASIPAIIVALAQDPQRAIGVLILYIIIFKLVNNVLTPIILGKSLNISPIIILAGLLMGNSLLGLSGVILSPAIIVVIYVLVDEFYLKKVNAKPVDQKVEE